MIDIVSPEAIVPAVLGALYGLGHVQERRRRKRGNKTPSLARPVKRFKRKLRGYHLKPKAVSVRTLPDGSTQYVSHDHKNWIRVFPNPGYRINGKHWCRHTHKRVIEWPEEA